VISPELLEKSSSSFPTLSPSTLMVPSAVSSLVVRVRTREVSSFTVGMIIVVKKFQMNREGQFTEKYRLLTKVGYNRGSDERHFDVLRLIFGVESRQI